MGFLLERGKCARHADGFTLLETMIALGVSAVAMVAFMNILSRQTLMQSSIQSRADMQDFVSEKRLALDVARDRLTANGSKASLWDLIKAVNFVATTSGSVTPTDTVTWNMKAQHLDEERRRKREPLTPTSRNDILVVEPTNLAQPFWIPNAHNLPEPDTDPNSPTHGQLNHLPGTFVGSKVDRARWINLTPPDLEPDAPDQLRRIRFTNWSVQLIPIGDNTITGFTPDLGTSKRPLYQAKLHFEADKALTRSPANSDGAARGIRVPGAQSMSADIDLGGQCEVAPQTGEVTCLTTGSGGNGGSSSPEGASTPELRAIVVVHSQTDQEPECPKVKDGEEVWEDLLGRSGYSYMGSQIADNSVASQDLGGMGSCVLTPAFQNTPTLECFKDKCEFKGGSDVGFWLFNAGLNLNDNKDFSNRANVTGMISRCRVCARKNTSVVTVHSYSKEPAKCPNDHSEVLWTGYSLKSTTTNASRAAEISQDLSGTGSCLRQFRKIPFTECKENKDCEHNTGDNDATEDRAQWLYAPEGSGPAQDPNNKFASRTAILDHVSRCAVCATSLPK